MKKRNSMNLGRSFLGMLLVMTFMIIGTQQANAQYLPVEDAINRLGTEIMVIHNATPAKFVGLEVDAPESNELQKSYYKGAALQIKETMNVQQAIDANHVAFLERFPTATAKANQYRAEVEDIVSE